jgi:DNA-binding MarR family transcriptional regulator
MPKAPPATVADEDFDEAYCQVEHQLGVLIRRARALSASMGRKVHPELDSGAYGLLVRIDEGGPVRSSDLAAYLGVGKATISRQVKVLEALGLIGREPDPLDRRAQLLVLTEEGRQRLDHTRAIRRRRLHTLLSSWPNEDVRQLAGMLDRFNTCAQSMGEAEQAG